MKGNKILNNNISSLHNLNEFTQLLKEHKEFGNKITDYIWDFMHSYVKTSEQVHEYIPKNKHHLYNGIPEVNNNKYFYIVDVDKKKVHCITNLNCYSTNPTRYGIFHHFLGFNEKYTEFKFKVFNTKTHNMKIYTAFERSIIIDTTTNKIKSISKEILVDYDINKYLSKTYY